METVGQRLKKLREDKGLSQRRLAALCKCADVTILKLEKGESKNPSAGLLMKLVEVFGKSERYILFGEDGEIEVPTEQQQEFLSKISKLSERQRQSIMNLIDDLLPDA